MARELPAKEYHEQGEIQTNLIADLAFGIAVVSIYVWISKARVACFEDRLFDAYMLIHDQARAISRTVAEKQEAEIDVADFESFRDAYHFLFKSIRSLLNYSHEASRRSIHKVALRKGVSTAEFRTDIEDIIEKVADDGARKQLSFALREINHAIMWRTYFPSPIGFVGVARHALLAYRDPRLEQSGKHMFLEAVKGSEAYSPYRAMAVVNERFPNGGPFSDDPDSTLGTVELRNEELEQEPGWRQLILSGPDRSRYG